MTQVGSEFGDLLQFCGSFSAFSSTVPCIDGRFLQASAEHDEKSLLEVGN